jgi:hypothetical protein
MFACGDLGPAHPAPLDATGAQLGVDGGDYGARPSET